jgi:hypothetical protein
MLRRAPGYPAPVPLDCADTRLPCQLVTRSSNDDEDGRNGDDPGNMLHQLDDQSNHRALSDRRQVAFPLSASRKLRGAQEQNRPAFSDGRNGRRLQRQPHCKGFRLIGDETYRPGNLGSSRL